MLIGDICIKKIEKWYINMSSRYCVTPIRIVNNVMADKLFFTLTANLYLWLFYIICNWGSNVIWVINEYTFILNCTHVNFKFVCFS